MIIKKTIYVETVEILVLGSSRWRKAGLEAEVEDNEDVVAASHDLKKTVDEIHQKNNADLMQPVITAEPLPDNAQRTAFRNKLKKCKTIADLSRFNREQKGMTDIYTERLKELQKK